MKPLILITNDDGIRSKGIKVLVESLKGMGELMVVAPDNPNSGMGHAITVADPIFSKKYDKFDGVEAYEISGTPADCVKLAKHFFLKGRKIDLVVSGINHGMNASVSVLYSGTMSAAVEGAIEGIPAIGFSLDNFNSDAEFSHTQPYIKQIVQKVLREGMPADIALNVNFPAGNTIKGIKMVRQTNGFWKEEFIEREDPIGNPYFWMGGEFINRETESDDTDIWALENNYVGIVPIKIDRTDYEALDKLKEWKL